MIRITSQTAIHQYDDKERAITTWDAKKCAWIVNKEFEDEQIDWYGKNNDFPAGYTLVEFLQSNPNWNKMPDISVSWYWTKEEAIKEFGYPWNFGERSDYWDKQTYPYSATRHWGYLDYTKEEAIEQLGKYCKFNRNAHKTVVSYNREIIHDGPLV